MANKKKNQTPDDMFTGESDTLESFVFVDPSEQKEDGMVYKIAGTKYSWFFPIDVLEEHIKALKEARAQKDIKDKDGEKNSN